MRPSKKWLGVASAVSPLVLSGLFVACGDDENAAPENPPVIGTGGRKNDDGGSSGGKATGGKGSGGEAPDSSAGGAGGSTGGDGGSGGEGGEGSGGSVPVPDAGSCTPGETGENGCFECPQTTIEFHNRCTSSSCVPFDNEQRLPRFAGYPLPALQ